MQLNSDSIQVNGKPVGQGSIREGFFYKLNSLTDAPATEPALKLVQRYKADFDKYLFR